MDTLIAFLLAGALTLFFVRGYLKKLTAGKPHAAALPPRPQRPCPRCAKPMEKSVAFCPHCGAAMAMWIVHQAPQQTASVPGGKAGAPKPVINASLCIGCGSCVHVCPETGTLALDGGKAILSHPERCTGHAKCAEACPTQAITLSFGGVLQTMRVPLVRENFETNIPGVFIVGELCGMGLIKTAINEGKLVVDHLRARLQKAPAPASDEMYDVAIVGAGPAGLSASLSAQQHGLRYLTLEQGEIAATIRQYPRQKFLMAEPVEIPLYGTLYVGDGTKEALLSVWETIIRNTGVQIRTNEKVLAVERNSAGFHVRTATGDYRARNVVLAMGKRGSPRKLGAPGEELPKVSYRLIEADSYDDLDALVVGGGDSAVEAALALSRSGKNRVTLCHRGDDFPRLRERNREKLEAARAEGRVQIFTGARVTSITAGQVHLDVRGRPLTLPNHLVFVLIGGESPEEFLRKTGIEIVEKSLSA
ncbi:MAG TPA: NAD(P)-binding domain-containing protein [Terriglobales bacterium]|nr:NAD(P)-binding domain-containing protein [Terriglobales bacterium]